MREWSGNSKSIYVTIGASNHSDKERQADDYYATDPAAIDKLLTVEAPNRHIWECACGGGHLARRLKERGYLVVASDIVNRGYPLDFKQDFLQANNDTYPLIGDFDILTNPPYKFAQEFVSKALEVLNDGCKCYMFLKLTFLEGQKRYNELFRDSPPPQRLYVFSSRISCAMNGDFDKYPSSAVAYAWFVWQKGYTGETKVEWL